MSYLNKYFEKHPPEHRHSATIAFLASLDCIKESAPDIVNAIVQELKDQRNFLKLIASENYSSLPVQLAMGNLLTDKYAEGHPFHRFYAGCDNVDTVESIAQQELIKLFDAEHAYVQPHSGADANLVAFWAILVHRIQNAEIEKLGKKNADELTPEEYETIRQLMLNQKVLGLSLNSGGHLTHGFRQNISSKMMHSFCYDVNPNTELLNYDTIRSLAQEIKPTILLAGYSSYSRKLNFAILRDIADSVGAHLMVDMAHFSGLVAGKAFTGDYDPVPFAHIVTSTTHKTLRGPRGGFILCKNEYKEIVNKGCPLVLGGPLPHVIAAKAIAFREANQPEFQKYATNIIDNATNLCASLQKKGIRIVSGGTENHLMVFEVTPFGINGRQAETALRQARLTVNRNAIPFDKNGAWYTSGIRIGTPAMTTLGMGAEEMEEIADIIFDLLSHTKPAIAPSGETSRAKATTDPTCLERCHKRVRNLLDAYPLYPELTLDDE